MSKNVNLGKIGRSLSFFLRHRPDLIAPDGGWASVDTILFELSKQYPDIITLDLLEHIVAHDPKGRYTLDGRGRIRANQGHSVAGVKLELESAVPPDVLYHGTAARFLSSILSQGLLPMGRQFVHLSTDVETARAVGARHGKPTVVLEIHTRQLMKDGYELKRSTNGIWLAKEVPPAYMSICE